tara:strand:+ start:1415 stop:1522 length:108 start_codon:yes stop_codon:yes gene_type:complete
MNTSVVRSEGSVVHLSIDEENMEELGAHLSCKDDG